MHNKVDKDKELAKAFVSDREKRMNICRTVARKFARQCGKRLTKKQVVHHKNHDACDHRCSNLVVMGVKAHRQLHNKDDIFASPCANMIANFF
jgi:hypothetical protein